VSGGGGAVIGGFQRRKLGHEGKWGVTYLASKLGKLLIQDWVTEREKN